MLQAVENTECVVFVSERVLGTLASVLEGGSGRAGIFLPSLLLLLLCVGGLDTANYSLIDFEYRWGLSQVGCQGYQIFRIFCPGDHTPSNIDRKHQHLFSDL